MSDDERRVTGYEEAAMWYAMFGLKGADGDPWPPSIDPDVQDDIENDRAYFEGRVRDYAYARAMALHAPPEDEPEEPRHE